MGNKKFDYQPIDPLFENDNLWKSYDSTIGRTLVKNRNKLNFSMIFIESQ